ncbi:MAG TPA: very short patch repair endonuclease [Phycisphaerae bacterium]|nr:very short patch repair endonuclease [Phycisphaerae bacterium]
MADVYSKAKRSEIMSRVRTRRTAPEDAVAAMLRRLRVRFRRNVKSLPGNPDLVLVGARTAIFVHGCFWHGHPNCSRATLPKTNRAFWKRKITGNRRRDARSATMLRKQGWHVVTVWQCRLRRPDRVLNRLRRLLASRQRRA